ncbi:MAG: hypothetical protein LCH41_09490 [Armatimonadetes bacterium]|nr:hypothetical protein [Armatimonadota bacterium]
MMPAIVALVLFQGEIASAPATNKVDQARAELKSGEAAYQSAKAAYAKSKSEADKRALVEAAFAFGEVVVLSPVLRPMEKYPQALGLFREVQELDPTHAKAKEWDDQIVMIYKSLGKEPPTP